MWFCPVVLVVLSVGIVTRFTVFSFLPSSFQIINILNLSLSLLVFAVFVFVFVFFFNNGAS